MKPIPSDIWAHYSAVLKKRAVPVACHSDYRKWLQYFFDFRSKLVTENEMNEIRYYTRTGRPLGSEQFVSKQDGEETSKEIYIKIPRETEKEEGLIIEIWDVEPV